MVVVGALVVGCHHSAGCLGPVDASVGAHVEVAQAQRDAQVLAQGALLHVVLVGGLVLVDVAHVVAQRCGGVGVERQLLPSQRCVEADVAADAPVAVDVLRTGDLSACLLDILGAVADAVACGVVGEASEDRLPGGFEVVVVVKIDVVRE